MLLFTLQTEIPVTELHLRQTDTKVRLHRTSSKFVSHVSPSDELCIQQEMDPHQWENEASDKISPGEKRAGNSTLLQTAVWLERRVEVPQKAVNLTYSLLSSSRSFA